MSTMNSIRDTFFEECEDLLAALSDGFAAMQASTHDAETVNAVFRAVHSIKGGAGAFHLADLVSFAHRFETVLDELRAGRLELSPDLMFVLLRSADHLTVLVEAARDEVTIEPSITAGFLASLDACLGETDEDTKDTGESFSFAAVQLDIMGFDAPSASAPAHKFNITFAPSSTLFANGHDPAFLFEALSELGNLSAEMDISDLPEWDNFDPSIPFIKWSLVLETDQDESAILTVFEFVDGLCTLTVSACLDEPEPILETAMPTLENPPAPQVLAAVETPSPRSEDVTLAKKPAAVSDPHGPKPTLRVDLDRVDRLINAVGELIINQAMISQRVGEMALSTDSDVVNYVEDYRLLARDIQEAVMAIRAQPVKPLFQRMSRIVREAADATGKRAQMISFGEEIEVDKTVIERLADPLTHMIRNAVDHGLEDVETRIAAGKDPSGTIRLSAAHRSGRVIISIKDDGAGLNREKILGIAKSKGLVPPDIELPDAEIDALLFLPGFSTASKISNLSGRGVGLDVVRTAVMALGGRVAIMSNPGLGTEFTISLPLTLAVMDGMVVSVGNQTMVAPIASILETMRPAKEELHMGPNGQYLSVRGKFVPIVDVADSLGIPSNHRINGSPLLLLVESENQSQCALIVDEVHDQRQVVIKGLEHNYATVSGVSAATVLGNGQIALILDLDAIAFQRGFSGDAMPETATIAPGE
jgi:two-component system, chemotaxis family, sensor kinase CheA